jgi:YD repeat-containing protein
MTTRRGAACLVLAAALGQLACHSSAPSSSPTAAAPQVRDVLISAGESFSARGGAAALRDFTPEMAPVDSGGECVVGRTSGSGATVVNAYFPSRAGVRTQMTINFDSAGRLVRVTDRWGVTRVPSTVGITPAQRDSTFRAASSATRTTQVMLDYVVDQAFAMNRGGGRPTDAITASVRDIERLRQLGPPVARIERVRRLCAV